MHRYFPQFSFALHETFTNNNLIYQQANVTAGLGGTVLFDDHPCANYTESFSLNRSRVKPL